MAQLTFEELRFKPHDKDRIRVNFHERFYVDIEKAKLESIAPFSIEGNTIDFRNISQNSASRKFSQLISHCIATGLKHAINNKRTAYIHANSGIPLMGTPYFGIIDRDSYILEVRPNTGCNFNCIYCSVDEGFISKRTTDYFVEANYLVQELKDVVAAKKCTIDIHIGSQGEPTLYPDMLELIKGMRQIKEIRHIAMVTNGSLLTKEYVDQLAEAGLSRINLSLNTLDFKAARQLAGIQFDIKRVIEIARYIPSKMDLIIAPLWVPGYNDDFLELVRFAKEIGAGKIGPGIGIQNFLPYKRGRNPVKPASEEEFNRRMKEIEQKEDIKLVYDIVSTPVKSPCKSIPKPIKKGEIIKVELKIPGRFKDEVIGIAKERCVSVIAYPSHNFKEGAIVKAKVIRTKHNIYAAKYIG